MASTVVVGNQINEGVVFQESNVGKSFNFSDQGFLNYESGFILVVNNSFFGMPPFLG